MLNIVCVRAGTAFAPEYVTILHDMIRRNLKDGYEGRFVCFTDRPEDLPREIEARELPADLPRWWSKLALFRADLFPKGDRVLFFDLDTVIIDNFDALADYRGPFTALRDFFRPNGLQSSVMAWESGECADIWETFANLGCPLTGLEGDQDWVDRCRPNAPRLQDLFPSMFVSFKKIKGIPNHSSIVVFHGRPRPHEVKSGWVPDVWKIGGITGAALEMICNTERERIAENVRYAMTLPRPWFDFDNTANDDHAVIVGGGPSLVETLPELRRRYDGGQHVWALNGTAAFLRDNGIIPKFHVVVDARPENQQFVEGAHSATRHLIASQCDPKVFKMLAYDSVTVWHTNMDGMIDLLKDERERPVHLVGGGNTVGLNAMSLAYLMGYRKMHLYGFDSCYRENRHHAYPQALNESEVVVDALVGDRKFKAAPWMVDQANQFQALAGSFAEEGVIITVAGDGLIAHMAREMTVPETPAETRAGEVLSRIAHIESPVGAEIGVFAGDMSARLLDGHKGLRLRMIDSWEGGGAAYTGDSGDWHAKLGQDAQNGFYEAAMRKTAFAAHRRHLVRRRSLMAADFTENAALDFAFIDADHSYEGAKADIAAWFPKVKPGGWLSGHDYMNTDWPGFGVTEAVDEFAKSRGLTVEFGENFTWFIHIPETT